MQDAALGVETRLAELKEMGSTIATMPETVDRYEDTASRIWLYSSAFWFMVTTGLGIIMATELASPNTLAGISFMEFGRIRQVHVGLNIFAWLSMAFVSALFYLLPRLLGLSALWNEKLGYWCAWAWNLTMGAAFATMVTGYQQGREYWEFIWPVDIAMVAIWILVIVNILMTVAYRRLRSMYVSVWWFIAAPLWLGALLIVANVIWHPGNVMGNGVPGAALSGALQAPIMDLMLNWWGAHNLFGMWLTPMLIGITYYIIPRVTNTPLYSHTLSLISFWGIAFIYTSVGGHHVMQAPIPVWARTYATFYSILLLIPVFAFFSNVWLTMRHNWDSFPDSVPVRFCITGFLFYILVNVQGSFMAVQAYNRLLHFTDFTIGHAHMCLLGGMTLVASAAIYYILPSLLHRPIFSRRLAEMQYWLVTIGLLIYVITMWTVGYLKGENWINGNPEVNVLPMIHGFYIARAASGWMIFSGAVAQAYNVYRTLIQTTTAERISREAAPFLRV